MTHQPMANAATTPGFVHLRVHSSYSLLESALTIPKIVELAKADGQPAVALTDTNNLFGALEFSEKAAGSGVQPIAGLALRVDFADRAPGRDGRILSHGSIGLIARTEAGFHNLMHLTSRAFLDTQGADDPFVSLDLLSRHLDGLTIMTGGPTGALDPLISEGRGEIAAARLEVLANLSRGDLAVELQRHGAKEERAVEAELLSWAYARGLPILATNGSVFATSDDFESHDALLAIAAGRLISDDDRRRLNPEFRFKSRAEMQALFADLPEALSTSVDLARRVVTRVRTRKAILPRFVALETDADEALVAEAEEMRRQAREGLGQRLEAHGLKPGTSREVYDARLEFELGVIEKMQFPGYFLIVSDFIKWAKSEGIPVGPGRGSGAGSLVAWSLFITDLDPLRFDLLFERFLNPDRVSMPDFDIDFCQDRREEVIRYVQRKYGRDQVAQIITFGTLQARGVMRDVGRVLEMPYGQVDKLTKLVPVNPAAPVTLSKAIADEPRLRIAMEEAPVVGRLLQIAQKLEGLNRHASTHAAGIVIGDRPLSQLVPLYRDPKSDMPVTQYNMKWVEQAGLVKFDFLGLKTLTVLEKAVHLIAKRGITVDIASLPLDDQKTYAQLQRAETVGVFQLESAGMRKAIADIKPDRFEDIIALVALYRPGPMANIPVYGARKHGHEKVEVLHEAMRPILAETYGIIVYQEQVMQIAQALSGYTLGEADLLRRAMGKKIRAEMEKQRVRFVSGATERDIPASTAEAIFDLLAKFADYGFNKSHAAAYALVAYQTAWLKANHPVEFLAASMTLDRENTEKLAVFRDEARRQGVPVDPPDVSTSAAAFDVHEGRIVYALAALKGVGVQAVEHIVETRKGAPFLSLVDFARRINPRLLNKRTLECLAASGAFDKFEPNRARAFQGADAIMALANAAKGDREAGQSTLFDADAGDSLVLPNIPPWMPAERLQHEFGALGFFLSGHPLDEYEAALKKMRVQPYSTFQGSVRSGDVSAGRVAGIVVAKQERNTKTGNKMGIITLSDATGTFEATCFQELLFANRDKFEVGTPLLLQVKAELTGEDMRLTINDIQLLDQEAAKGRQAMTIFLSDVVPVEQAAKRLSKGEGDVAIVIQLDNGKREVEVKLPGRWMVSPQVVSAIKAVPGVLMVEVA
jgi:DNA polymerase III subunit alpha